MFDIYARAAHAVPNGTETMQQLKEIGIYALPSERGELVAHAAFRGGYFLYTPKDWESFGPYTTSLIGPAIFSVRDNPRGGT